MRVCMNSTYLVGSFCAGGQQLLPCSNEKTRRSSIRIFSDTNCHIPCFYIPRNLVVTLDSLIQSRPPFSPTVCFIHLLYPIPSNTSCTCTRIAMVSFSGLIWSQGTLRDDFRKTMVPPARSFPVTQSNPQNADSSDDPIDAGLEAIQQLSLEDMGVSMHTVSYIIF